MSGAVSATYRYDSISRLREVVQTQTSVTTSLYYDAQGARYKRTETGQATSLYFGEWVESRGGELIRLVHGGGLDNVLAEVTATSVRRLITDGSNNIVHVAEASGTTFERRYEAFGDVRNEANPLPVERGFAGRPTEGSTGLLNLRARHYDPHTGRFLQVDPIGIQSEQFYAYAGHNPFVFADPLGLSRNSIATGGGASAAFASLALGGVMTPELATTLVGGLALVGIGIFLPSAIESLGFELPEFGEHTFSSDSADMADGIFLTREKLDKKKKREKQVNKEQNIKRNRSRSADASDPLSQPKFEETVEPTRSLRDGGKLDPDELPPGQGNEFKLKVIFVQIMKVIEQMSK